MQYLVKKYNKILLIGLFVIFLPVISIVLSYIINKIYNLGVYFGSIARYTTEGICCFKIGF